MSVAQYVAVQSQAADLVVTEFVVEFISTLCLTGTYRVWKVQWISCVEDF